jgi:hypothetical protein
VHWQEMPGSKIKFTSILHMAFELAAIKVGAVRCINVLCSGL